MRESLKEFISKYKKDRLNIAECGVMAGANSQVMRNALGDRLKKMYLIDSWRLSYRPEMHDRMMQTVNRFENDNKVCIIRDDSTSVVRIFSEGIFDYVYLDDAHGYNHVLDEIIRWIGSVKKGGMLAGHDINPNNQDRVLKAVQDFCKMCKCTYSTRMNEGEKVGDWWIWKQ